VASGEPVFIEAMRIANIYGIDACAEPLRRLRKIGNQQAGLRAVAQVEAELGRQAKSGERPSVRRASERVAVELGIEAPSLEAARKRIEGVRVAHRNGHIADGDTRRDILVAKISCNDAGPRQKHCEGEHVVVVEMAEWHPDNAATRQLVADEKLVVLGSRHPPHKRRIVSRRPCAIEVQAIIERAARLMTLEELDFMPPAEATSRIISYCIEIANKTINQSSLPENGSTDAFVMEVMAGLTLEEKFAIANFLSVHIEDLGGEGCLSKKSRAYLALTRAHGCAGALHLLANDPMVRARFGLLRK
jgi:hypothetical protein